MVESETFQPQVAKPPFWASGHSEEAHTSLFHNVLDKTLQPDPIELLETVDAIDAQEARATAAFYVVTSISWQLALADQQQENDMKLLNTDHQPMIEH